MKSLRLACLIACALSGAHAGTLFDFKNEATLYGALDNKRGPVSFTNNGLIATFTASSGYMNRTASGFGINASISGDDTDAFDVDEWIDITFGTTVTLTNVTTGSWNNGTDQATLYVNDISNSVITASGNNAFNISVPANQILQIYTTAGVEGNGWSLNSIAVDVGTPPVNNAPILSSIGNTAVMVSNSLNFAITATDIDNDLITLSANNLPPGAVFKTVTHAGNASNIFSWAVAAPTGTYTPTFYADDGTTNDFETIMITVSNAPVINAAPVLNPIGSQTVTEGQLLMFLVNASDANKDPLTFSATDLPPGAVFSTNTITPQFTWSPAGPAGIYTSRFIVADSFTHDFEDVVITVLPPINTPPILNPISNQSLTVSNTLTFEVTAFDADNDVIMLSATNIPHGAVFSSSSGMGSVTGQFNWAVAAPTGTYTPTFFVHDGATHDFKETTITVTNAPAPPPGTGAVWNVFYNLPMQSSSGANYPGQFVIRDALVDRIDALKSGDSAILSTFTFSAEYGAGVILNAMNDALDQGASMSFIADGDINVGSTYGGTPSLFSLSNRSNNPLNLVIDGSSSGIMHDKLGLFDYGGSNQWVFITSWNFTLGASANQWNIALEARSPSLYTLYKAETDELLAGHFHDDPSKSHAHDGSFFTLDDSRETHFARFSPYPDDTPGGNNAETDIIRLIDQAQSHIVFALNKFNRPLIRDALIAAANRGVTIQGVMPKSDTDPGGVSDEVYNALTPYVEFLPAYAKADYSALDSGEADLIHAKYMGIDPNGPHAVVIHGSANWTSEALVNDNDNDENVVFLYHDAIAKTFYDHFQRITGTGSYSEGNSTLISWNFEDSDPTADGGISANATQTLERAPTPSCYKYSSDGQLYCSGWNDGADTACWETSFSSIDHTDIKVSSVQTASDTGPSDFKLQYKTGAGETYLDVPYSEVHVPSGGNGVLTRILLPAVCNNQTNIFLRWLLTSNRSANGGTISGGNGRIDDIILMGTAYDQPPVLDPIGNHSIFEDETLRFSVSASDPVDDDPVTLSANNLPPGATFSNGTFTWDVAAPAGSYHVTFTATDKDGSDSEVVPLTVIERPQLMISEIADPAGDGEDAYRFIELYNAGTGSIDLAANRWHLSKQVNGGTWCDIPLTGTVAATGTWVIASDATDFQDAYAFAPNMESSIISGNGDDAFFLYYGGDHSDGILIDVYGEFDTDGSDTAWDYENSRALRNSTAIGPNPTWTASEWIITAGATTDSMNPGAAYNTPPILLPIGTKGGMEGRSISFSVTAEDLADDDVITLTATPLPPGANFSNGTFIWDIAAPAGSYDITFTATDDDGSDSEVVTLTVVERPNLMISEIADPSGTGADAYRFIELYNAGTGSIDLAANRWHLSRQTNDGTWHDIQLAGMVTAAKTWVIAYEIPDLQNDFFNEYGFEPDQQSWYAGGNGDDAFFLFYGGDHSDGILIDIYGEFDTDGSDTAWDYENSRAERNNDVSEPNTEWTADEWTIQASATTHSMTPGQHGPLPQIDLPENLLFVFSGDSFDFNISASNHTDAADSITLSASSLPAGAVFTEETGVGSVDGQFTWDRPPDGTYPILFTATGKSGSTEQNATLTVSDHSTLNEWFYRWKGREQIYALSNGQFWQQTSSETYGNYGLYSPDVTIGKQGAEYRMTLPEVLGSVEVRQLLNTTATRISGTFGGCEEDGIVKLQNGTWWRQTSTEQSTRSDYLPEILLWQNDGFFETLIEGEDDPVTAEQLAVIESEVTGLATDFSMAHNKIYPLADGTLWKQTSSDSVSIDETDITAWRWTEDGSTWIRFVDRSHLEIGTCRAETTGAPENPALLSRIDGYFRGWKGHRVFALQNGDYWQQTTPTTVEQTLYNPRVIITNILSTGTWQMRVENALPPATVEVEQRPDVTRLEIDGWFHGFRSGNFFRLSNHTWWRQTSSEIIAYNRYEPEILLYGNTHLEMTDLGAAIEAELLDVQSESTVIGEFNGLAYGKIYTLQNQNTWQQLSTERTRSAYNQPAAMLWMEDNRRRMLLRDELDQTIGTCSVVDPDEDSDGDQIANAAEIIAGSDLFDAKSKFKFTEPTRDESNHFVLHWKSVDDRIYSIEWAPSMAETFQPLEPVIAAPQNSWTDTVHTVETEGFYRIGVRLAE